MIARRTDLALEARELWQESAEKTSRLSGVKADTAKAEGYPLTRVDILDSRGEEALDILMAAKYLERIGDHATNLAEWVEYAVTGQRSKDGAPYVPGVEKSGM